MKLRKRTTLFLLILIIFINIVIRYPRVPHEVGADSFLIHSFSNTVMELGQIPWISHPTSYLGLYPNSYPAGGPVLLAAFSGLSGLSMENTILVVSGLLGLLSCVGAFLVAGTILPDNRFKLFVAFGYSTSPLLLKFSMWTFSTRIMFLTLLPLFLWAVLSRMDIELDRKYSYYVIAFLFLLAMATTHRLFWMALFFALIMVYFNALMKGEKLKSLYFLSNKLKKSALIIMVLISYSILGMFACLILLPSLSASSVVEALVSSDPFIFFFVVLSAILSLIMLFVVRREKKLRLLGGIGMLGYLLSLFLIQYTELASYRSSWYIRQIAPGFVDLSSMLGEIIALGVVIGARYGLFLIPAVLGIIYLVVTKRIETRGFCVLAAILVFLPFIHLAMYLNESLILLFIFMSGIFLMTLLHDYWNVISEKKKSYKLIRKYGSIMVILFLGCSLIFSIYTTEYRFSNVDEDTGYGNTMTDSTYNAGIYARTNDLNVTGGPSSLRVEAISGQINSITYTEIIWQTGTELPHYSDILGWYRFLKQPYGSAEINLPLSNRPVYAVHGSHLGYVENDGCILFASSDTYLVAVTNEWI